MKNNISLLLFCCLLFIVWLSAMTASVFIIMGWQIFIGCGGCLLMVEGGFFLLPLLAYVELAGIIFLYCINNSSNICICQMVKNIQ